MTARWQVRALIVALAVLLMLPVLFIFAQNEQELSRARNKTLARWPGIQMLVSGPERYFSAAKRWINDRVGLGITAAGLVRWVTMYAFRDDPTLHLTLNGDHLFLNAWAPDPAIRFSIFRETCRPNEDSAVAKLVRKSEAVEKYFRKYGAGTAYIFVPTTPVLYADKLPPTVPRQLRQKCLAALRGDSLIGAFAAQKGGDNVIYPLQDFIAHRDSNSFYPARSFHFQGESIWLVARRYFERLHLEPSTVPRGTRPIEIRSELSRQLGFELPVTINSVSLDRSGLSHRAWPEIPNFRQNFLRSYRQGADVGYFENDTAKSNATALILSNSFGVGIRGYLSLGYKSLFHVNISQLRREELKTDAFFAFLMKTLTPDQVIVVSHDGGADGIIARIAGAVGGR